jgi:hypothetical protein
VAEDLSRLNAAYAVLDALPIPTDPLAFAWAMHDIYAARMALGTKAGPNPYLAAIRDLEASRALTE